ncbi:MAG TPA: hypothetical protein VK348_13685 [Planctomycetota bacterium]|nr:hypothetical protein [Planctomycetota bacterium]
MRTITAALVSASLLAIPARAQGNAAAAAAAIDTAQLLAKACDRMLAAGNGAFKSTEEQDNAIVRKAHLPARGGVDVDGGWNGDWLWASAGDNGDRLVRWHGRMVVKDGDAWKLRADKLASGAPAPFVLDPALFFQILRDLPAGAGKVLHSETTELAGKQLVILSLSLADEPATEFAASGAVPGSGGGPGGGMLMLGGGGGFQPPQPDHNVDLALFVDPANGDVHRLRVRVYEQNPMFANMQIQVNGHGGGNDDGDDEKAEKSEPGKKDQQQGGSKDGSYKKGLPDRKLAADVSLMYFKVDFQNLGMAEMPAIPAKAKALLGSK